MPIHINIWLLLFGGVQGLLLSLVLVKKKTYRNGYGFLIAYLLVMLAQILFKVLDKHWLMEENREAYLLSYKFPLLYGPLIWLFTRRLIQDSQLSLKHLLHFLPFVYSLVIINLRNDLGGFAWLYWPMQALPAMIVQIASLLYYHVLAFRIWKAHHQQMKEGYSDLHLFQTQWIKKFTVASLGVCVAIASLSYLIYLWYPAHNWLRFGFLLLPAFIYYISYAALQQPQLFTEFIRKDSTPIPLLQLPALVVHRPQKKYAHSTLTDEEAARILTSLDSCMQNERLFTEPQLTIDQLVLKLRTNRYQLSQVLNEKLGQSFYAYVNSWRVAASKEMLADPRFAQYKIGAIGYEAGFNSLSTFNEVFKKVTGITPSEYKKHAIQQQQQRV